MNVILKDVLKSIRASQPFNCMATATIRSILQATGLRSEKVIKHLHRVGQVRSRLPNGRILHLWSRGDDWVSNQIYWRGWDGYESETVPLFFGLACQAMVTIDVGAHVGFYTLLAAHANPKGKVYAFEPMPAVHERLRYNVGINKLDKVECFSSAVGEVDGEAAFFHLGERIPSSSSLSLEFMQFGGAVLSSRNVEVITLDRFVRERKIGRLDLLKIDTESTEPQVLRGMADTLRRDRPDIVCEVLKGRASVEKLEAILRPLGYRYYLLCPTGPLERDRIEGHPTWLNYLFSLRTLEEVALLGSQDK